ncbi:MAG: LysE family translocator [Candidatus Pelagadaptatus aseana]|uniref:LysE family translocator n=1 Tax=Candidatus Pelagadaptatus aseana TaxID=3120508 RepID=UPI0039B2C0A1
MTLFEWLTLAGLCWMGAASPGPSLAVMVDQTMKGGRQHGIYTALAHGAGVGCYALLAALGLALALQQSPVVFDVLRWLGAAFLLYLAYKALTAPTEFVREESDVSVREGVLTGFLTAFLNPKLAIFFLAVYTQFITEDSTLWQKLGMAAVSMGVDALWYVVVVVMVSHPAVIDRLEHSASVVNKVFGVLLIVVAARVLLG